MPQIYLLYEKLKKVKMGDTRILANLVYVSTSCSSPAYSNKGATDKKRAWENYMNSLDWDFITDKKSSNLINTLKQLGVKNKGSGK